jgi:hypothetical protein
MQQQNKSQTRLIISLLPGKHKLTDAARQVITAGIVTAALLVVESCALKIHVKVAVLVGIV